jgi:hypothetical protein
MDEMKSLEDFMNRFFTRYLNRSGLTTAAFLVFAGMIDLFWAFRNHDRTDAIGVAIISFIVIPAFALWSRRRPATDSKNDGSGPSFR